jgi:LysM repeat protein
MGEQFDPEQIMQLADSSLTGPELCLTRSTFRHLDNHPHHHHYSPDDDAAPSGNAAVVAQLASVHTQVHTVRSGDTLGHIAQRYGTSVTRLCQLNGIRSTTVLQIGQRLKVR